MKKVLAIFSIVIVFLIVYFLQANLFNWFDIAGIGPNMFIIYAVFLGLFLGKEYGMAWGLFFGLILDLFIGQNIGINAIVLGLVGLLAGIMVKNFSGKLKFIIILVVSSLTMLSEIIKYLFIIFINHAQLQIASFSKILAIEILYNVIIVIITYPIFQKFGENLEKTLLDEQVPIKYF